MAPKATVVQLGDWSALPMNRRQRRTLRTEQFFSHLYAGEDEGYTLQRALKAHGCKVDLKRGPSHDMLTDQGVYSTLVRAALKGKLRGICGGPNCRSRSVLRHRPIQGQPWAPRPSRCWNRGEYGAPWINKKEEAMIQEDDLLMWRMLFLYMIAEYSRRAQLLPGRVQLALEQPASPRSYQPEAVSIWDTEHRQGIRDEFQLKEVTFNQGDLGGPVPKPTTLGTTFDMCPEDFGMPPQDPPTPITSSKQLERWALGLMNAISHAIIIQVYDRRALVARAHRIWSCSLSQGLCRLSAIVSASPTSQEESLPSTRSSVLGHMWTSSTR